LGVTALKETDTVPCYSGHQVEDIAMELPPGKRLVKMPENEEVKSAHMSFTATWSMSGQTLNVHREFASKIDQPLCSGDLAKEAAAMRQTIRENLRTQIALTAAE
jgi:hypothetical protein